MKKGRNTAEVLDNDGNDFDLDDLDLPDSEYQERTLVLKAAPPSRRAQLLAQGVVEIRCTYCNCVKPLAGAEESEEGWVCEDCVQAIQAMMEEPKYAGQRGR